MQNGRNGRLDRLSNSTNRLFHCWYCWKDLSPKTDATKYLGQKETRLCGLSMCPEPLPVSTILSNTELRAANVIRAFAGGDEGEEFEDMTPRGQPRGIHQDHSGAGGASGLACGSWCGWWVEKHS